MTYIHIYLFIILIIYLTAFFVQNIKTRLSTKQPIRGRSPKLTVSLALSTIIYLLTFGMLFFPILEQKLVRFSLLNTVVFDLLGLLIITLALFIGLAALYEMKNSWRVGIKYDQKTDLVTTGIYSISRNPYFLSYNLLFGGVFLVFPTGILLLLVSALIIIFHQMILEEEGYLAKVQGEVYEKYKNKTGRYLFGL
jgi:protein-S-isoprenylcysteine O-methyltransferase Ste14